MLQMAWWTAHQCFAKACTGPDCGFYADMKNKVANGPDSDKTYDICDAGMNPAVGESPQMFVNCADIVITGGSGGTAPTTQPVDVPIIDAPAPFDEVAPEPDDMPNVEATTEAPVPVDDAAGPVVAGGVMLEEEEMTTTDTMTMITALLVKDIATDSLAPLSDTIVLADYPSGIGIRAEAPDPDDIMEVVFSTSTGIETTEYNSYYDMFNRGSWPDPSGTSPASPSHVVRVVGSHH